MWRPANWSPPDRQDLPDWSVEQIYEAGANDMLEALKNLGKHTDGKAPTLSINVLPRQTGWLVFIPDKEA